MLATVVSLTASSTIFRDRTDVLPQHFISVSTAIQNSALAVHSELTADTFPAFINWPLVYLFLSFLVLDQPADYTIGATDISLTAQRERDAITNLKLQCLQCPPLLCFTLVSVCVCRSLQRLGILQAVGFAALHGEASFLFLFPSPLPCAVLLRCPFPARQLRRCTFLLN